MFAYFRKYTDIHKCTCNKDFTPWRPTFQEPWSFALKPNSRYSKVRLTRAHCINRISPMFNALLFWDLPCAVPSSGSLANTSFNADPTAVLRTSPVILFFSRDDMARFFREVPKALVKRSTWHGQHNVPVNIIYQKHGLFSPLSSCSIFLRSRPVKKGRLPQKGRGRRKVDRKDQHYRATSIWKKITKAAQL